MGDEENFLKSHCLKEGAYLGNDGEKGATGEGAIDK